MKLLIGVQARTNSQRFPRKIYQFIGPKALLRWVYDAGTEAERILRAKGCEVSTIVLGPPRDEDLANFCRSELLNCELVSFAEENDLIGRYLNIMIHKNFTHMIRLTADCWQMNPALICEIADLLREHDYVSNTIHRSFIEGVDLQGCSLKALEWFNKNQINQREHPFYEFDQNENVRKEFEKKFKYTELLNPRAEWTIRTSIDTKEDLERANKIYEHAKKAGQHMDRKIEERPSTILSRN